MRRTIRKYIIIFLLIYVVWSIYVDIADLHKDVDSEALVTCLFYLPPAGILVILYALEKAMVLLFIVYMRIRMDRRLDPRIRAYLEGVRSKPPAYTLSIEELRKVIEEVSVNNPPEPVWKKEEVNAPGPAGAIPIRIYTPEGTGPFPAIVFYHGGGWCIGSLNSHDNIASALANRTPAIVFSVDYRLAPENPFPAAVEDCFTALKYVSANAGSFNADPKRLAVMGDSAGGNLAAAISLKAKEEDGPTILFQALVYPATNLSRSSLMSYLIFSKGYDLDKKMLNVFKSHYLPDKKEWKNPYASPALAADLTGLPPTLLITAEFDPLRDDGAEFAKKLKVAGVPTEYRLHKGVIHGFIGMTGLSVAQNAIDEIAASFRGRLADLS